MMYLYHRKVLSFIFVILLAPQLLGQSQNYPPSNIHLLTYDITGDKLHVKEAAYLTNFNNEKYNNQPFFLNHNKLLVSSQYESNDIDIIAFDLANSSRSKFTKTQGISEFSPKLTSDKSHISTIRVEADGETQSLWQYPIDKSNYGHRLLNNLSNIGYHEWLDDKNVIIFQVGDPHYLKVYNLDTQIGKTIATNIGRCFKKISSFSFYFVSISGEIMYLKKYDLGLGKSQIITEIKSQDFDVDQYGNVYTIYEDKLRMLSSHANSTWKNIFDLKSLGIEGASRITIYDNLMAIVSSPKN